MFFPYKKASIITNKSAHEVIGIIRNNTSERVLFSLFRSYKSYFEGEVTDNGFKINRVIRYRNSFLPIIIGTLDNTCGKTQINLKMRLHLFVIVFGLIWFSGSLIALIGFAPNILFDKMSNNGVMESIFPLFFISFGYLLFTIPFIIESKIALNKLVKLVYGELI